MVVLALGDVVGEIGLQACEKHLWALRRETGAHLVVVNGENADGVGIRPKQAARLFAAGADVVTLGNHACRRRDIVTTLQDNVCLLRPDNMPAPVPGGGVCTLEMETGQNVAVINLLGRYQMDFRSHDPFTRMDTILNNLRTDFVLVDFHAEATSEKLALGHYLDGRVSAVWGTHTHVQTADEQILPNATGYITDLGMCGARGTVLGIAPAQSIAYFLGEPMPRHEEVSGPGWLEGAYFVLDDNTGRCVDVRRVSYGG